MEKVFTLKLRKRESIYTIFAFGVFVVTAILMYIRCFYGTELTDEAYYVSEAKEMLNGNIPFAINNSSKALGYTFLLVCVEFIYSLFVPSLEGVFLFTRLCFVTFKIIISIIIYFILKKSLRKADALLLVGILLPISYLSIQNFSYNTIPIWTTLLSGTFLFDVLEQTPWNKDLELILAGFIVAIGCFANPGWGLALVVFLILMIVRIPGKNNRIRAIFLFYGSVFAEVLIVAIPIIMQTSVGELCYGLYRLFIHSFPMESLAPHKNWHDTLMSFLDTITLNLNIFSVVLIAVFALSVGYIFKYRGKPNVKQYWMQLLPLAFLANVSLAVYKGRGSDQSNIIAFTALIYIVVFMIMGAFKEEKIIWYLGVVPALFSVAEIILIDASANISRFAHSFTIVIPLIYVLLKQKSKWTHVIAALTAAILILATIYANFHYVYRDDIIQNLDYRVESGVYKGIYTTADRAHDLPELEEYLNGVIGEGESYAFRDNVPSAYLMVHGGKACEISTWDYMQYAYGRNAPAVMYDYYRRRDMIPDKIIYVDFGRDPNLSIEDPEFRYNDWVNAYYDLVEDVNLNGTYRRIMVYQYNGTFDGDYQYWIDTYYELIN